MKIKPLFDRVVIVPIKVEKKTSFGIVLPDTAKEKPVLAEVIEVGPGIKQKDYQVDMVVKVGDKILYNQYAAQEFKLDDKEVSIIKQSDILAIVTE